MRIENIIPEIYTFFYSNYELFFLKKETKEILILTNGKLEIIGKSPFTSTYNTIYGFAWVSIVNGLIVSQSNEAIMDAKSEINEVIIFNLNDGSIKERYKENILLSDILVDENQIIAEYKDSDLQKKSYCIFDFMSRSQSLILKKNIESNSYIRNTNHAKYFLIIDNKFVINWINSNSKNVLFETEISKYLIPPPKYTNGEDQCQNKVEKVLYCKKNEVIVVFLMPFKLLGIDAINGQVLWELDYQLNSNQLFIDEETGFLYIAESYFTGVQKANVIRFNVIDTKDGKKVFEKDLDYFEVYNGKQGISSILYFAGLCNSYFYITFLSGEIFKLRKETAEIVERYKHDKPFYGPPQIVGNRLFVSEDTNSKKHLQRLLIFEL